jgi:hypothetical protein
MKMSKLKIPFLVSCVLLIAACSLPAMSTAAPTPNIEQTVNAVRTESALTAVAAGQDAPPLIPVSETPAPSMTVAPSHTVHPTLTNVPTNTHIPTLTTTPTITRTATRTQLPGGNPKITILAVERNTAVSVKTENFPANQIFTIRIGHFNDFNNTKKVVGSIASGYGGTIYFTSMIPDEFKDVDKFTIRLDSNHGYYAYNAFEITSFGTVAYTATPKATYKCEVKTSPSAYTEFPLSADFDASWEIKNTGTEAWDKASVDYKHLSGTELQKYGKAFDMPSTVDPDGTITLVVDMVAPNTAGTYTANWAIVNGDTVLCYLPVTIKVK